MRPTKILWFCGLSRNANGRGGPGAAASLVGSLRPFSGNITRRDGFTRQFTAVKMLRGHTVVRNRTTVSRNTTLVPNAARLLSCLVERSPPLPSSPPDTPTRPCNITRTAAQGMGAWAVAVGAHLYSTDTTVSGLGGLRSCQMPAHHLHAPHS